MKECFCQSVADIVDKISRCEALDAREIAWVERALILDTTRDLLLNEAIGLDMSNIFGMRFQPGQNSMRKRLYSSESKSSESE